MPTIRVIDDNPAVATALEVLFSLSEIDTVGAELPEAGLAALARQPIDLVIQDMNFSADTTSGEEGARLFREIHRRHPALPVILLTAWTQLEAAIGNLSAGGQMKLLRVLETGRFERLPPWARARPGRGRRGIHGPVRRSSERRELP